MKLKPIPLLFLPALMLILVGCGGGSGPRAAPAPAQPTPRPTATPHVERTVEAKIKEVLPAVPTPLPKPTEAPSAPTSPQRPTATPIVSALTAVSGLVVECALDEVKLRISCGASGYQAGSQLTWTSTASYANSQGNRWHFTIHRELAERTAHVFLEECQGSDCQTIETLIDLSGLNISYVTSQTPTPTLIEIAATATATGTPALPTPLTGLVLPFPTADKYLSASMSFGALSYAGAFVIGPFGGGWDEALWSPTGENVDLLLELVPGTIVRASVSGTVRVSRQELDQWQTDPEGEYDADWGLQIFPEGNELYQIEYDHLVDLLVHEGQRVEQGDPLGRAAPARIRGGGPSKTRPVDEFEWGIRSGLGSDGVRTKGVHYGLCPESVLIPEHQQFLRQALRQMTALGFPAGPSVCLVSRIKELSGQ